jgi:hypothetical protein
MRAMDLLKGLYAPEWIDEENRSILVRYYTTVCAEQLEVQDSATANNRDSANYRFRFAWARVTGQKHVSFFPWLIHNPAEDQHCIVESVQRVLPDSLYLICAVPIDHGQWEVAERSMDAAAGLLRQVFGNNVAHDYARQALVNIDTGDMVEPTRIVRLPRSFDGPWLGQDRWVHMEEILNALAKRPQLEKRVFLALELLERGYRETGPSKFFYLWTSLEVLWGTHKTAKLQQALQRAYATNPSFIVNKLGFGALTKLRQAVVHDGEIFDVAQDVEAYVQRLFLDLLIQLVELPCRRLLEKYIQEGFDLSRLSSGQSGHNMLSIHLSASEHPVSQMEPHDSGSQ